MTMKQMKGIGAAALTLPFLLLVVVTFDSQQGNLTAQVESSAIASAGNMDLRKAEASLTAKRLATAQAPPEIVEIERVDEDEKVVENEVEDPIEINDGNKGHGNDDDGHDEDNPGNSRHGNDEDGPGVKEDKNREHDNDKDDDDEHGPGSIKDESSGHGDDEDDEDEHGSGAEGDESSGHGDDEDD